MKRLLRHSFFALMSLFITGTILTGIIIIYFEMSLPNVSVLKNVQLQIPLRIYTKDGELLAEYGEKRRIPVDFKQIPPLLIDAVLATEDQRYYEHPGVDPLGLLRAMVELVETGTKSQGGSTITMQVARNFFLTRKKTFTRKFKEILLAIKIDSEFSKQKVLELYLNKIYLGNRAYGVGAAAQVYYGKTLNQLTLPQIAMLAGLPKAPSALNPLANKVAAKDRRDHVLWRMHDRGYITQSQYEKAIHTPLTATFHGEPIKLKAKYVAEMVRDAMVEKYGPKAYTDGFNVYTTILAKDQIAANQAVSKALMAYDHHHGYRGPITQLILNTPINKAKLLKYLNNLPVIKNIVPAVVLTASQKNATVLSSTGKIVDLNLQSVLWAKKEIKNWALGKTPKAVNDVLKPGDVIRIIDVKDQWFLTQIPKVQGALVALNPHDGAVIAMVGGFDYKQSKFNRATQAERQPGSSFKPFIYAAALAKGYTLASLINDAPVVVNDPSEEMLWRPQNDTRRFYGPTRLRVGLMQSRNLVSIRLLRAIGPDYAADFAARFGFDPAKLPHGLSLALGSALVTPLEMATGYAVFANGGYKILPYLINHIINSEGKTIYQATPKLACENCSNTNDSQDHYPIAPMAQAPRVISSQVAYLMTSAMQSVIKHGTGRRALTLKRSDLAGKTGTTNNQKDAWFGGFNSDIVTVCWVGFDVPSTLHEYGAQAALPMWIDFMKQALQGKPENTMAEPADIITARIDPKTGLLAYPGEKNAIFEIFRRKYAPTQITQKPVEQNTNTSEQKSDDTNAGEQWGQPLF